MKLIIKNALLVLAAVLIFVSCAKDKELLFDQPASIYVESLPDSAEYSFATTPTTVVSDSVLMRFRIIGKASSKDRVINLVPRAGATAKPGYHYKIGKAVVKANEFAAIVPIYLYRKAGLKDSTVIAIFDIKENEDFKLGFPSKLRFKLTISDILTKPAIWDNSWAPYFGSYTQVKFRFLLTVTGRTNWTSAPFPGDSRFLAQRARVALLEYNQQFGPLIDENGAEVFFP
ncbi:DUF4843 domain-containing protein [Pedobacter sp. PWIIR3]